MTKYLTDEQMGNTPTKYLTAEQMAADAGPASWISGGARTVASGLTEGGPLHIAMAPIILGVGFLLVRAAVIKSKPLAESEVARRALGVWPRLMIVFSFIWSALVIGGIAWLNNKGAQIQASLPLAFWTFGPLLALWVVYFAAKWVRQGVKVT